MLDERSRDIKRTQFEVVGQYNKVLTALQDAANAMRIAEDLNTRLIAVESKLSLGLERGRMRPQSFDQTTSLERVTSSSAVRSL